jgi:hypothetical protein
MAAVLLLILLPIIAGIGFFLGANGHTSLATIFAGVSFVALAAVVLVGALRVVHDAEGPETH